MCGIAGMFHMRRERIADLRHRLQFMNDRQRHRGPDGEGIWMRAAQDVGLAHRRLSIIDLDRGQQPMADGEGNWIVYNGEIYNYIELRQELGSDKFSTTSDTEVILRAYRQWGADCLNHLRGMFAFALWDEQRQCLFCARDRFGIKPFYFTCVGDSFYFASEIKALLPFMPEVAMDLEGLKEYLTFQFCLLEKTLFKDVHELPPGHCLQVKDGAWRMRKYWEVYYTLDLDHTAHYFEERLCALMDESVRLHLRSDVPLGAYVSGGLDSSIVATLAAQKRGRPDLLGFVGKFPNGPEYDETPYARMVAKNIGMELHEIEITGADFIKHLRQVIYHLDYPVAGPGSFPQFMVSQYAARHRKVLLGGQGGDEIFGGYTRYLMAYFEQCIKAAIDGTTHNGNFIVTYESIIPNLTALRQYKPLLQEFWSAGLFEGMDQRYFRLINRAPHLENMIRWEALGDYSPFDRFKEIFHSENVGRQAYFDLMTHFDFKTLLPALLQVEDRVSMAHGLESRVPLLDHQVVELAATIPANIKFTNGAMKHVLRNACAGRLPPEVANRKDKMGFPTPLTEWIRGEARDFIMDVFGSQAAQQRSFVDNRVVLSRLASEPKFGRNIWGLLCLEIWQQEFIDPADKMRFQPST